ncbi:MAG: methyltransferase domain-containing protein [Anaerolineae bacterium]|nr:methyltransferase domain-containing protein [Anaerolineae bacterium]
MNITASPPSYFDNAVTKWVAEMATPWMRLKRELARFNLNKHLPTNKKLRILDAGGGVGTESFPFAGAGHEVVLVDYSAAMIEEARRDAAAQQIEARVSLHVADVMDVTSLFDHNSFDLVLCHNVLQYVADVPALLRALAQVMKPEGVLSLISTNHNAGVYHSALFRDDLDEAYRRIDDRTFTTSLFGNTMTEYAGEEVTAMLTQAGLCFEHYYGLHNLLQYWGNNERRTQPENWAKLEKLEYALTDHHPHNLLARYWQVIACKV